MAVAPSGLENVIIGPTAISCVNGDAGELYYRGYDVRDLAREASFEEVVWLLWHGDLPTATELARLRGELARQRVIPDRTAALIDTLARIPAVPMAALALATGMLGVDDPAARSVAPSDELQSALLLVARYPTIIARYERRRHHLDPVEPPLDASTATAFLTMLRGAPPDPVESRALDVLLIVHADHELNASTFTARVIASTLASVYAAVEGALGALSGPLHGGANERVMTMLEQIGTPEQAEPFIYGLLAQKKRIMGFGHRVYKTEDPRAAILREVCLELARHRPHGRGWCDLAMRVAEAVWQARHLYPNVDFFSAPVQHMLGIPTDLFTPVFAMSRVAGWTAHVMEQHAHNRLIRPRAEYVGPPPRRFVPLAARG
ncbi:MAG TPA: citrate/2-methylcitrate synthase [Chloroflexota bacterium]|nr:citrate/2-methylcitrate synthase [Chloroflexota bacterium]